MQFSPRATYLGTLFPCRYTVRNMRQLGVYLRTNHGSLYASIPAEAPVSPGLIRNALHLKLIERCGEYLYLTDSGIHATLTT